MTEQMSGEAKVAHALHLADLDFRVFPCKPNSKEPACYWQQEATADPTIIRQWFVDFPDMNYGVVLGDDYFALDLDCKGRNSGADQLAFLELINGEVPQTFTVNTPSGGEHRYFRGTAPSSVGKKGLGDSIDVRGQGGYVLGPGSSIDGKFYEVIVDAPIAPAPDWLLGLTARRNVEPKKRNLSVPLDAPHEVNQMRQYLARLVEQGDVAIEFCGGNHRTYKLFCTVLDFVSPDVAFKLVVEIWNPACQPPWNDDELHTILANAIKYRQNEIGASAGKPPAEVFKEAVAKLPVEQSASTAPDTDGFTRSGGLSFRSMQDIRPVEIDWLWQDRIAAGKLTLIAGAPDGGKSQIAANIAATISNGGAWPFSEGKAEQGAVIWLSAEDDPADTTVPRLIAAGANRHLIFELKPVVRVEGGLRTLNVVEDLAGIADVIEKIKTEYGVPVRAIVIDPISAYMGGRSQGDSWKNSDVRHTMTPLLEFVGRVGISTIGITHFKKGKDTDVLNRVIDSIALPALSRATWLVAPEKDDEGNPTGRRLFLVGKKNIGRPVAGLAYKIIEKLIDNGHGGTMPAPCVEWAGIVAATADDALAEQTGKAGKLEAAEDFLMRFLGDGPLTEKEIRKRAGEKHRWRTLQRAKEKLGVISERAGGLAGSGEWQWALPGTDHIAGPSTPDVQCRLSNQIGAS